MKTYIRNLVFLPALIAGLGLILVARVMAQTFTVLHSFTAAAPDTFINSDGALPVGSLVISGNNLYGMTYLGGSLGGGTVFKVNNNGTGFTNLYYFTALSGQYTQTNSDGARPAAGLILSGSNLYGTGELGGSSGGGTVFKVNTNGTGFTNLHNFSDYPSDGSYPWAGLVLSGDILYGTTQSGGSSGVGTVFRVNTNGTGLTILHSFTAGSGSYPNYYTNSDGAVPLGSLILSGNTLYGTASGGGSSGGGTVFKVNTNGTGFTNLYSFTGGGDGADLWAGLVLSSNTLYGAARIGGNSSNGTVFAVNTDGTGFTNLHSFTALNSSTNSDGAYPYAGLILSGNTLYGTASGGGGFGNGTVFAVNTDGTGFTNLYSFTGGGDGAYPWAGLILSGNTLYGTASNGGGSGGGTVFSLSWGSANAPQLHITCSGADVILTWTTSGGTTNVVQFTPGAADGGYSSNFTDLSLPIVIPGTGLVTTNYPDSNGATNKSRFYRIRMTYP